MHKFGILLGSLLALISATVHAEQLLQFKEGQKAAYTIEQTIDGKIEGPNTARGNLQVSNTLDFTLEIVSVDPKTGDFPMVVEVKVNKLKVDMALAARDAAGTLHKRVHFDGKKGTKGMAQIIQHLKSKPIRFNMDKDFEIRPLTNRLEKIEDAIDDLSVFSGGALVLGANELQWKLTLQQIFHLAGQQKGQQIYKVSNVGLSGADLDDVEIIKDKGQYAFTKMKGSVLAANWTGDVHVKDTDFNTENTLNLSGRVTWNKANPLVQTRDVTIHEMENDKDSDGGLIRGTVRQKWTSREVNP